MLFNSYVFLLVFLPVVFAAFRLAAAHSARAAKLVLLGASLVWYAGFSPRSTWLLLASIAFNYVVGRALARGARDSASGRRLLAAGVVVNVVVLVAFKVAAGAAHGTSFSVREVVIPLGVSFFTFQQIGWLVDARRGRAGTAPLLDYAVFVTFFPHLVMGPIVRWRDLSPQLQSPRLTRLDRDAVAVGLTLIAIGLFKKTVLADGIAGAVDVTYAAVALGHSPGFTDALGAALGFSFQIYFDFSAYADIAIGLGRLFNLDLPINFDSPYRATNRFELWRRWHVTFTEFMRAHVFVPLVRLRLPGGHVTALLLTAVLSGLWHGTGWQFGLWGLFHGLLLLAGHGWRRVRGRLLPGLRFDGAWARLRGVAWTMSLNVLLGVLFRAGSLATAASILLGLGGANGLRTAGISAFHRDDVLLLGVMAIVVWALPNTQRFLGRHSTAIDPRPKTPQDPDPDLVPVRFEPRPEWAWAAAALLFAALLSIGGSSRFVYYQF